MLYSVYISKRLKIISSLFFYRSYKIFIILFFNLFYVEKKFKITYNINSWICFCDCFFLVGEIYHSIIVRLIYFFNGFFVSNYFFSLFLSIFFLLNSGFPLRLSFISELLGIISSYVIIRFLGVLILFYFFCSFYYSMFFIIFGYLGKIYSRISDLLILFILPYLLIRFNFFFFFSLGFIIK